MRYMDVLKSFKFIFPKIVYLGHINYWIYNFLVWSMWLCKLNLSYIRIPRNSVEFTGVIFSFVRQVNILLIVLNLRIPY